MDRSRSAAIDERIIWGKCIDTWNIPNIEKLYGKRDDQLSSPIFFSADRETKWQITLWVQSINKEDYVSLTLKFKKYHSRHCKCFMTLLDSNHVAIKSCSFLESSERSFDEFKFLQKDILQSRVPNGEIYIHYEVYFKITKFPNSQNIEFEPPLNELRLGMDLLALLENGNYSDMTLTSSDGKEFKIHKNILITRSPVFAAMLEHDMLENRSGQITITDFDSINIELLLRFIYSGKVDLKNFEVAITLLDAAEKYQLADLKKICLFYLSNNLRTSNALQVLELSDQESAKDLKVHVIDFIVDNFEKFSVAETTSLVEFINPQLMADLWKKMAVRIRD